MATRAQAREVKPLAREFAENSGLHVYSVGLKSSKDDSWCVDVGVRDISPLKVDSTEIKGVTVVFYEQEEPCLLI